ncbi:hypothetical protein HDZ31DRAFT_49228 [Schizophyllum fasciatum]
MTSRNRESRSRAASLVRAARSATSSRSRSSRASSPGSIDLTEDTAVSGQATTRKRKHRSTSQPGRSLRSRTIAANNVLDDHAARSSSARTAETGTNISDMPDEAPSTQATVDAPNEGGGTETLPDLGLGTPDRMPSDNGKGKQRAASPDREHQADGDASPSSSASAPPVQQTSLTEYTCPICFFAPTNATLTPCGHICCGSCLFTAVKTAMLRAVHTPEGMEARCPVCRATIPGWDGHGGGVIGLKLRSKVTISL